MIKTILTFIFLLFFSNIVLGDDVFESVSFQSPFFESSRGMRGYGFEENAHDSWSSVEKDEVRFNGAPNINNQEQISSSISYADWAVIALTCVAVLVTVLGVLIALLSFWGFRNISKEAKNISEKTASNITEREVASCINGIAKVELAKLIREGELREPLENAVDMIFRQQDLSTGFSEFPELDEEINLRDNK